MQFGRSERAIKVTIGNVDLPAVIRNGFIDLEAPLGLIFQAFGESVPAFIGDMEIRVSTADGTALSPASARNPVYGHDVVIPSMVRDGWVG